MFIEQVKITNFKKFNGEHGPMYFNIPNGEEGSGLNILIGENNSGKSTVFEAIDFLRNSTKKDISELRCKYNPDVPPRVEVVFSGDIRGVINGFSQENKKDVFNGHIFVDNEVEKISFSRVADEKKNILIWSKKDGEYKNKSGIDAPVKKLFETNFVWADTNPNDQTSFGSTTISGNLLKEIMNSFTETEEFKDFSEKFHATFNEDGSVLKRELQAIEQRTQEIFFEQFGEAVISFHFNEVKIDTFFKNISIVVDDGVETRMDEKGSGMQRSIALALIQVYAEKVTSHPDGAAIRKPFFLFIDEPEICLHPKAQEKLFNALLNLSRTHQVFITTHSPYFLVSQHLKKVKLFLFKVVDDNVDVSELTNENSLFPWSPTWGEVNFSAYNLPTVEFHNELYGYLQEISGQNKINDFDNWLESQGLGKIKKWTKQGNGGKQVQQNVTLQTFIRNKIHHPENTTMQAEQYTHDELRQSIENMIDILNTLS